jgi:hypothetical protein
MSKLTAASPVVIAARAWSRPVPVGISIAPTLRTISIAVRTARSPSFSCAVGVPHTAITASPMNFSSDPP